MADRRVKVIFSAEIQGFKRAMDEAAQATQKAKKASEESSKAADTNLGKLVQSASKNSEAWNTAGASMAGFGVAALAGVGLAVKSFAEFDKRMSSVQASTHASGGEMSQLRDLAIAAGADTAFSAKEAAQGIEELAKAGVSTSEIMKGGLAGSLALAAAGELDVGKAAEIAASALTQFKLEGEDIPHVADLLAAAAGKAQGSVEDMGAALNQTGLVAASTGLTIEETTGGLAAFASAGLTGSDAGTSLKTMLQRLTPQSKEAEKAMTELGISAYDAEGQFVGLAEFSENLKTSMQDLTPEARNAAMAVIFGSDAVRAANILYEQGGAGVDKWTAAVNESGYAAQTAAMKQNNLAGDIEKLGGSLDSVFLKSASGANDALRGLVQGAEDLVDAIGQIPAPILNVGLGMTAIAGGAALAGGAFLSLFPKIIETRAAFATLASDSPKAAAGLSKVGKAAGVAAAALVGLQIIGAISKSMAPATASAEAYGQAFLTLNKSTSDLDGLTKNLGGLGTQINGVGDALARRADFNWFDELNNKFGDLVGGTSKTQEVRDSVIALDETLAGLASNGGAVKAAESFKILAEKADESAKAQGRQGVSTADALKLMPEYTKALEQQATAAGVNLSEQELLDFAMGKIPASMQSAAGGVQTYTDSAGQAVPVTEDMAEALAEIGISAQGTVTDLVAFTDALVNAGLLELSARDAARGFEEAIDAVGESLKKNGATMDIHTEQGRANQAALDAVAGAGIRVAQANAANGASQQDLQGNLQGTYNSLIDAAAQFNITGDEAIALARDVLGVPDGVAIDSWMSDAAKRMAEATTGALNAIDGRVVRTKVENLIETINKTVTQSEYRDDPSMVALKPGQATGGILRGYSSGGQLPSTGPGAGVTDGFLGVSSAGVPVARLDANEWIINGRSSQRYDRELAAINAGTFPKLPGYANGGREYSAQSFAQSASSPVNVSAPAVTVMIGNEQLDSRMYRVASSAISTADSNTRYMRGGK